MSFNPLMTLLVRGVRELCRDGGEICELGNQTFRATDACMDLVLDRCAGMSGVDMEVMRGLRGMTEDQRRDQTANYCGALGFAGYTAIDINDEYGSLVMDLNRDLRRDYDFQNQYELVTNNGTGEHIFNQLTVYENVHNLTLPGGVMLHVMPYVGYLNHGFYSFHPNLYYALAVANGYEVLAQGVATRFGRGILAQPPGGAALPELLAQREDIPMSRILASAKLSKTGFIGTLIGRLRPKDEGRKYAAALRRLSKERPNLLTFAVLRKTSDDAFKMPIQTRYEDALGTEALQQEYLKDG